MNDKATERIVRISWANFVRFGGIEYLNTGAGAPFSPGSGRGLNGDDLGREFGIVRRCIYETVHDVPYEPHDGDAAFLPVGTSVYEARNYLPTFRLAAYQTYRTRRELSLYEADSNPQARQGRDLLDITGKVVSIRLLSAVDTRTELGRIEDPEEVEHLVALVMHAPVDQERTDHVDPQFFVSFDLRDGTATTRSYWPTSGELSRGIILPVTFAQRLDLAQR